VTCITAETKKFGHIAHTRGQEPKEKNVNAIDMTRNGAAPAQKAKSAAPAKKTVGKILRDKEAEFIGPVTFALQVACVVALVWVSIHFWA
jgi:uncharacterized membrane protein